MEKSGKIVKRACSFIRYLRVECERPLSIISSNGNEIDTANDELWKK